MAGSLQLPQPPGEVPARVPGPQYPPVAILIVDDKIVERRGLEAHLAGPLFDIRASLPGLADVLAHHPGSFDVAVCDLISAGSAPQGGDLIEALLRYDPGMRVLGVSGRATPSVIGDAIGAGALGFLTKGAAEHVYRAAVLRIATGRPFMTRTLAGQLLEDYDARGGAIVDGLTREQHDFLRLCYTSSDEAGPPDPVDDADADRMLAAVWSIWRRLRARCRLDLSERDQQFISFSAAGESYVTIARGLHYAPRTVRNRIAEIACRFNALYGAQMKAGEVARYLYAQRPDIFPRPDPDVRGGGQGRPVRD